MSPKKPELPVPNSRKSWRNRDYRNSHNSFYFWICLEGRYRVDIYGPDGWAAAGFKEKKR